MKVNDKLQSKITKRSWEKVFGRNANVQMTIAFLKGIGSKEFIDSVGSCLNYQVAYHNGKTTYLYTHSGKFNSFLGSIRKKILRDTSFAKNYKRNHDRVINFCLWEIKKLKNDSEKADVDKLLKIYHKFIKIENQFYFYGYLDFIWDNILVDVLEKELKLIGKSSGEISRLMRLFSLPGYPPPVVQEEIELMSIAANKYKKGSRKLEESISEHAKKFGWMSVYNFGENQFTADYYFKKLKKLKSQKVDFNKEVQKMKNRFRSNESNFQMEINNFKKYKKVFILTNLLHNAPNLRDEREEYRDKIVIAGTGIYESISKKLKLPLNIIVNLTDREIIEGLKEDKSFNIKEIKSRMKKFAIYFENGNIEILTNNLTKIFAEKIKQKSRQVNLKGIITQRGKVKGRVRLILGSSDLKNIKKGYILVTTMTKPNYIPAMGKAAAFITDEGGILCHAAIVSREMKKPCIVGTKVATQVLKDGDLVEVDAERGVVKIIRKAKTK